MKTRLFLALIALISLVTSLAACNPDSDKPGAARKQVAKRPPQQVVVIQARKIDTVLKREYAGRVQAWRTADVRARVEGIVEKRLFNEGTYVAAGTPLFLIENDTYLTALESARTEMHAAQRAVERNRTLLRKKLAAPDVLDEALVRYRKALAQLARAKRDLANTRVPAPIEGRIGRAQVTEGAFVGRNEPTLLATIEQIDTVYVDFKRNDTDLLRLQAAIRSGRYTPVQKPMVRLLMDDGSHYPQAGTLLFAERRVDASTGSVLVRARFPNPDHTLLPGMYVRVRMPVAIIKNVIRVPQRAVRAGAKGLQVLIVSPDNKVLLRPVETAGMYGKDFLVVGGLQAGDKVIVDGQSKVRPGSVVTSVPWRKPGSSPTSTRQGK